MGWHVPAWYGATKCLGEHPAPSLYSFPNLFVLFIVSRVSSEYISEILDSSTHFWFAMPRRPDSLNHRHGWTSSLTVGSLLVPSREGTHSAPPGYSLLLCLGWVHCWNLQLFQERVEPRGGAFPVQD